LRRPAEGNRMKRAGIRRGMQLSPTRAIVISAARARQGQCFALRGSDLFLTSSNSVLPPQIYAVDEAICRTDALSRRIECGQRCCARAHVVAPVPARCVTAVRLPSPQIERAFR
jgi:hypothetical protein